MRFDGARILVTGASGFVGQHLVARLLADGALVHTAQRRTSPRDDQDRLFPHVFDLNDAAAMQSALQTARPDIVFHLAASRSERDWSDLVATNISAPLTLLQACAAHKVRRFVSLGSSLEMLDAPPSAYGASRKAGSIIHRQEAARLGLSRIHVRTGYVYGADMPTGKFIPAAIRAQQTGDVLSIVGSDIKRNYVYVNDVVQACRKAAAAIAGSSIEVNAISPVAHSAAEVVSALEHIAGRPIQTRLTKGMGRSWDTFNWSDISASAERELGWHPEFGLQQGLADMVSRLETHHAL